MLEEKLTKLDFGQVVCLYIPRVIAKGDPDFMVFSPKVVCLLQPNPFISWDFIIIVIISTS